MIGCVTTQVCLGNDVYPIVPTARLDNAYSGPEPKLVADYDVGECCDWCDAPVRFVFVSTASNLSDVSFSFSKTLSISSASFFNLLAPSNRFAI